MKVTGSTNIMIRKLIRRLKKEKKPLWRKVAEELEKPSRKRAYINIYKIISNFKYVILNIKYHIYVY